MNLFLKLLPYLIIVAMGFGIYFGFRYYESKISSLTSELTCSINEVKELKEENTSLKEQNKITVEQLQNIQKQVYESVTYISDTSNKIDSLKLDEDKYPPYLIIETFQNVVDNIKDIIKSNTREMTEEDAYDIA